MKDLKTLLVFIMFLCFGTSFAQIVLSTNLLHTVPLNKGLNFELRIAKGGTNGFADVEIKSNPKVNFKAIEIKEGEVSEDLNHFAIRWELLPPDSILNLKFKLLPIAEPMILELVFKYSDNRDDVKREFESQPFRLNIKDTVLPNFMTVTLEQLLPVEAPAIPIPPIERADVLKKSPAEIEQQVEQLKSDSQRAQQVGELEKQRVLVKLDTLQKSMEALGDPTGDSTKLAAYTELEARKTAAQEELVVAERVLTLAKTLDAQADEISRISKEGRISKKTAKPAAIESKEEPKKQVVESIRDRPVPMIGNVTDKGLVFKIQLGAFKTMPKMDNLEKAGAVTIVQDNNVYKALHGSFRSKEDAVERCAALQSLFPGCFIVAFQDGDKVK